MILNRIDDRPETPARGTSQDVSKAPSGYKLLAPKPHQRITPNLSLRPSQSPESSGQDEPRRPQTRQEWDAMKDVIRQLYMVENFTLEEVATAMLREHSFAATKRMYKRQFKRWDWKKYNTQSVQESKETGRAIEMPQGQTTCRRPMRSKRNINIESAWATRRCISARVPIASATPPTKLTCANGDDKRTLQLFSSLRDLIYGTFRRDNAGWSSENLRFTGLPTTGRLLVSQMDQAIRLFESKQYKQGGIMLREAFRSLEDVMERDAIEIYQVVLMYIPYYLPGRYKDVTRAWLHYTSQMLNLKKRHDPISQLAKLLYLIHLNNPKHLGPALERLFCITAGTYSQLRGTKDLSTLMATIDLLLARGDSKTSEESALVVEKLGSLVEEAAVQFGETSETTIGIEACQITYAARLMLSPADTKIAELCKTHVGRPKVEHPSRDGEEDSPAGPTVYHNHISIYGLLFLGLGCSTETPARPALFKPQAISDWEKRKETIRDLYITKNLSLRDVDRIMTEKHQFSATHRQYKLKFLAWNWKKYNARERSTRRLNDGWVETLPTVVVGKRPIRSRQSTVPTANRNHGVRIVGMRSSPQLECQIQFPNAPLLWCQEDERVNGLFLGLRDLLFGTSRINPRWRQVGSSWWLPDAGEHLVSIIILATRRLEAGEIQSSGSALRKAFLGIEDVIKNEALMGYQSLFLEIPLRLLETGQITELRFYTAHLWKMLEIRKEGQPITQMAKMLHGISANSPEALLHYLRQMHVITADILARIRGENDYNTVNARMKTLNMHENAGSDVSQGYLAVLDNFGALARHSTTIFGQFAYDMSRVECRRIQANMGTTQVPPTELKEVCDRSLAHLLAGVDHSTFLRKSQSISELAHYAVTEFITHECMMQVGNLDAGIACLMRMVEALERAQSVSSNEIVRMYHAGQAIRARLKLSDLLSMAGRSKESAAMMQGVSSLEQLGESM
ncbi:N1-acetylpolyamine oxidase [Colletotrichum asianum]